MLDSESEISRDMLLRGVISIVVVVVVVVVQQILKVVCVGHTTQLNTSQLELQKHKKVRRPLCRENPYKHKEEIRTPHAASKLKNVPATREGVSSPTYNLQTASTGKSVAVLAAFRVEHHLGSACMRALHFLEVAPPTWGRSGGAFCDLLGGVQASHVCCRRGCPWR